MKKLAELCSFNELKSADVLWANDLSAESLVEGTTLVIPASKRDILPVWQSVQRRRKGASDTLVSVKLHGVPRRAERVPPSSSIDATKGRSRPPLSAGSQPLLQKPPLSSLPPPQKIAAAAEKEKKGHFKEPALFLSPDGDSLNGPMRLVISGDNIAIVRLPRAQMPRTLSLSGIHRSLSPERSSSRGVVPKDPRTTRFKMLWPVDGAVSSWFGKRGKRSYHSGIDIPMPKGTPIRAAKDGVVKQISSVKSRGFRGYGNVVIVDHGNGVSTLYAHCQVIKVKKRQRIRRGETIGTVGRTGRATTHHVHFEVRMNGKPVDPIPYLVPRH